MTVNVNLRRYIASFGVYLLVFAALISLPLNAMAAGRTAWTAGNGQGLTWGAIVNSSDMTSLASGASVLSTVTVTNGAALDQFMDISCKLTIASSTIVAGANITFWIAALEQDGATYGDNQLVAGTPAVLTPAWSPAGSAPLFAAATQTTLWAYVQGVVPPPGSFKIIIQNNSGFALTAGTQTCQYRTYNINVNN